MSSRRSRFEALEEWLFKLTRQDPSLVFVEELEFVKQLKDLVEQKKCPASDCKGSLELVSFERGPKGWQADIKCDNCNFTGVLNAAATIFNRVNSKGKARD